MGEDDLPISAAAQEKTDVKDREGWNKKLMAALPDKKRLAEVARVARNELMSTELLSRPFRQPSNGSTKMAGAGDDPIGF